MARNKHRHSLPDRDSYRHVQGERERSPHLPVKREREQLPDQSDLFRQQVGGKGDKRQNNRRPDRPDEFRQSQASRRRSPVYEPYERRASPPREREDRRREPRARTRDRDSTPPIREQIRALELEATREPKGPEIQPEVKDEPQPEPKREEEKPAVARPGLLQPNTGPHPSYVQVAKPYVFEQELQQCQQRLGATESQEDVKRLQGVAWIDSVRRALQLPVRTYNTAAVYYHKFRLIHPDGEYDFRDAAAAALFNACKIEDTLKKSRDILCAAYNLKLSPAEHLSSDDPLFEQHSKQILGLERLMLEASGFDFRNRYPQKILMKLVKSCGLAEHVGATAYKISLDMYRTFVPLKQTTPTMSLATLELAIRVCDVDMATVKSEHGFDYDRWATTRPEIMETLVDMLDLYTHHKQLTLIGPDYPLDIFINIRIALNQEAAEHKLPRYTEWLEPKAKEPTPPPPEVKKPSGIRLANGKVIATKGSPPPVPRSPLPDITPSQTLPPGERAKDAPVRFMLDPERAKEEKDVLKEFYRIEEVEELYRPRPISITRRAGTSAPTTDALLLQLATDILAGTTSTRPLSTDPVREHIGQSFASVNSGDSHYSPADVAAPSEWQPHVYLPPWTPINGTTSAIISAVPTAPKHFAPFNAPLAPRAIFQHPRRYSQPGRNNICRRAGSPAKKWQEQQAAELARVRERASWTGLLRSDVHEDAHGSLNVAPVARMFASAVGSPARRETGPTLQEPIKPTGGDFGDLTQLPPRPLQRSAQSSMARRIGPSFDAAHTSKATAPSELQVQPGFREYQQRLHELVRAEKRAAADLALALDDEDAFEAMVANKRFLLAKAQREGFEMEERVCYNGVEINDEGEDVHSIDGAHEEGPERARQGSRATVKRG